MPENQQKITVTSAPPAESRSGHRATRTGRIFAEQSGFADYLLPIATMCHKDGEHPAPYRYILPSCHKDGEHPAPYYYNVPSCHPAIVPRRPHVPTRGVAEQSGVVEYSTTHTIILSDSE